jgi:hypothetical protein
MQIGQTVDLQKQWAARQNTFLFCGANLLGDFSDQFISEKICFKSEFLHVVLLFNDSMLIFSTGVGDTIPRRFLLQAGRNTSTFTRHHYHHFLTLSVENIIISLVCLPRP